VHAARRALRRQLYGQLDSGSGITAS
jgi:hypothetical protein